MKMEFLDLKGWEFYLVAGGGGWIVGMLAGRSPIERIDQVAICIVSYGLTKFFTLARRNRKLRQEVRDWKTKDESERTRIIIQHER